MYKIRVVKLISLNVGLFEKNNDRLEKFFKKEKADIVCLQEATRTTHDTRNLDYISVNPIYSATKDLKYSFYSPMWIIDHFRQSNFHGRKEFVVEFDGFLEFGYLTKSRYQILRGKNVFIENDLVYGMDWSTWPEVDSRSVQVIDLFIEDQKMVRILNLHGRWSRGKKGSQKTKEACRMIKDLANESGIPSIICGDFNLFPDTESMNVLNSSFRSLVDEYNIKTTRPSSNELHDKKRNVVDYIFVSEGIIVNEFKVIDSDVSDHLPLVIDFDLV